MAELEASADALLSGLTEPSGIPSATPTQAVTRASNALKAFESVVRRIKPLLDATATRDAPLDESILNAAYLEIDAKREIPAVSTANIQPIKIPQQPASSLNGLIDTFREVLGVEMLLQNEGGDSPQLIANYFNAFHLRVLLQSRNSLVPIAVNVRPIAQIPETGPLPSSNRTTMRLSSSSPSSSSSLPLLFDRLTSAAAIARLAFVDQWERDTKGASPLEMLLLWLATCAVREHLVITKKKTDLFCGYHDRNLKLNH